MLLLANSCRGWGIPLVTVHHDTEAVFAYQITPIGFRFGYNLAMFAGLGIGFRGLANAGVSISF